MIVLQLLLYCLLFTAMVRLAVIGGAVKGLYFYPKEVQDRAIELGLIGEGGDLYEKSLCQIAVCQAV